MTTSTTPFVDITAAERRPMRVCAYVELPFEAVVERLGQPQADDLLAAALHAAAGHGPADLEVEVHELEVVARRMARVRVSWRPRRPGREARSGTLLILAVQSGADPLTELLIDLVVEGSKAPGTAAAVRRFLNELERRLVGSWRPSPGLARVWSPDAGVPRRSGAFPVGTQVGDTRPRRRLPNRPSGRAQGDERACRRG